MAQANGVRRLLEMVPEFIRLEYTALRDDACDEMGRGDIERRVEDLDAFGGDGVAVMDGGDFSRISLFDRNVVA